MYNKSQFQIENDQLLEYLLENNFYNEFKKPFNKQPDKSIELNITPLCNQKCKYCYLVENGDKLYPQELRDSNIILRNTEIFLQFLIDNKYNSKHIDFFSGEIWGTKFGNNFLDIILDHIGENKLTPRTIMIPSNCSFVLNDEKRDVIDNYIKKFNDKGVRLLFSISVDGKIIEPISRPFLNDTENYKKELDETYNKLFIWAKKHDFGFHPMIESSTIDKWLDNLNWWIENLDKYKFNDIRNYIMLLEVRNDNWSNKTIKEYIKFLDTLINIIYKRYYNNIESFAKDITISTDISNYQPYTLFTNSRLTCSIRRDLIIRLGDLSIGPCHRTCYPEFIYGKYDVSDNKIIGVTANNVQLFNNMIYSSSNSYILCNNCAINLYCSKGCIGAQFESNKEPLAPCISVCEFSKVRALFLYFKYKKSNLFNIDYDNQDITNALNNFEVSIHNLRMDNKIWNKWVTIINSIATKLE